VDEVVGDVWARGAAITGKCMAYMWVPLKRVSCTYHGCKCSLDLGPLEAKCSAF
jgi:hypothetical protein